MHELEIFADVGVSHETEHSSFSPYTPFQRKGNLRILQIQMFHFKLHFHSTMLQEIINPITNKISNKESHTVKIWKKINTARFLIIIVTLAEGVTTKHSENNSFSIHPHI